MSMDKTNEKILKNLMIDARQSARQLALELGLAENHGLRRNGYGNRNTSYFANCV